MLGWEHFSLWTEKALNLYVNPGTRFFVGGHKVCRLEHKSAFSLWPCSRPLIIISSYKTKYSQLLHQGFVGISCEQSLAVPCSAHSSVLTLSGPSSGYRLCLREEGSVSVSGDITESVTYCHGTLSCFNSSLAVSSVLPPALHHYCTSPGGEQGRKGQWDFSCRTLPQMKWSILPQAFPANLAGCYGLSCLINPDKPFRAASWWSIPPVTCHFSSLETNDPSFCRQRCARKQKLLNSHSRQSYKILLPLSLPTTLSW